MLYELNCTCGRKLEFMKYIACRGLNPLTIEVGCPPCEIVFYYVADSKEEIEHFPHMNQLDWLLLTKRGKCDTKGMCEEMVVLAPTIFETDTINLSDPSAKGLAPKLESRGGL